MKIRVEHKNIHYHLDIDHPLSIAIPMMFNGLQPNTYGVDIATSIAYKEGDFIGDVNQGGSCNFEQYTLIPHCNGTHTECIGHISREKIFINEILKDTLIPSTLVSLTPIKAYETNETYTPKKNSDDLVITAASLKTALASHSDDFLDGLIIRTTPNQESKKHRDYMAVAPPFFTSEAMKLITILGVKHLLVDFPSVDRTFDEGKLSNHRIYWEIELGNIDIDPDKCSHKTITEMIYASDSIKDDCYFLNIQIPSFQADAAPSNPVLFNFTID